jgi:hypothetical protein
MQDVVKQKNKTTRLLFPSLNYIDIEEGKQKLNFYF